MTQQTSVGPAPTPPVGPEGTGGTPIGVSGLPVAIKEIAASVVELNAKLDALKSNDALTRLLEMSKAEQEGLGMKILRRGAWVLVGVFLALGARWVWRRFKAPAQPATDTGVVPVTSGRRAA